MTEKFPVDVSAYRPLTLDSKKPLDEKTLAQWQSNIPLVRDTIIFFTASAGLRGVDGHTGGAYDLVPEALLADGFIRGENNVSMATPTPTPLSVCSFTIAATSWLNGS